MGENVIARAMCPIYKVFAPTRVIFYEKDNFFTEILAIKRNNITVSKCKKKKRNN